MIYTGQRPKTVCSWDFKGKSGKDPKSSVVFSGSDPSSEKKRYQADARSDVASSLCETSVQDLCVRLFIYDPRPRPLLFSHPP